MDDWEQVIANDDSEVTLLVWADWLEEHGLLETAGGIRWLAKVGKRPAYDDEQKMFTWWIYHKRHMPLRGLADAVLPNLLWYKVTGCSYYPYNGAKGFPGRYDALR